MDKTNICQTLWLGNRNILDYNFGWYSPQYHLISWALSCLQLKKFNENVVLYTDSSSAKILIDYLQLPYTECHVDYDNLKYDPQLWAIPKLLTYSKQFKPFLHVDGDVFLWKQFDNKLLHSELIAQNLEIGSDYYKNFFIPIINELDFIPKEIKQNLLSDNIKSYNAGILGGSDLDFFRIYVSNSLNFIDKNKKITPNINFNIIFEQLFFYSLIEKYKKTVTCYFDKVFNDNDYTIDELANFALIPKLTYLHLIGPNKKNENTCIWMGKFLYDQYPETYIKIISLFHSQHFYYNSKIRDLHPQLKSSKRSKFIFEKTNLFLRTLLNIHSKSNNQLQFLVSQSNNDIIKEVYKYEVKLKRIIAKFNKLSGWELSDIEKKIKSSTLYFTLSNNKRLCKYLHVNPYMRIIYTCYDWTTLPYKSNEIDIENKLANERNVIIGVVPDLFNKGYVETYLDELSVNIIILAKAGVVYKDLVIELQNCFDTNELNQNYDEFTELIIIKIKFLISNKILIFYKTAQLP